MNKPTGYDETQAMGDYTPAEIGGHTAVIKGVKETQSKTGKPMVVVCFDFDDKDKQPGYFMQEFKDDARPDKKWPHAGTAYIMTQDYQDQSKTSRNFKTFCTCIEKSNNFSIQWGDNWGAQFKGKKIGVVFGEVENEYNGKTTMRHEMRWFCDYGKAKDAKVPNPKYLNGSSLARSAASASGDDFISVPAGAEEEVPF